MKHFLRYSMVLMLALFAGNKGFATDVLFDFDTDANTLFGISGSSSGSGSTYDPAGEFNEDKTATVDGVSITVTASPTEASTRNRIWTTSPRLRLYNGNLTVVAPTGHKITSIVFVPNWNSSKSKLNFDLATTLGTLTVGDKNNQTATWAGEESSIEFTINSNTQLKSIKVVLDGESPVVPPGPSGDKPTFDFDADANTLFGISGSSSGSGSTYVADGDITSDVEGTVDGVVLQLTPNPAEGGTPNRIWATSPRLRLYGGVMTITAPTGKNITAITFYPNWNSSKSKLNFDLTANTGALTVGDKENQTATWAGQANSIVFTINSNTQLKKLEVELDGEAPAAKPVISGTTPFDDQTTVTIQAVYEDDVIYYTTDGTNPTSASTVYRGPFTITETTTVKAVEEDAITGDLGEVVEMVFTKNVITYETVNPPYTETLQGSYGKFQIEGTKTAWKTNNYGAVVSAKNANTMLVSPFINLTNANTPKLSFEHQGRFFTTPAEEAMLCVREEGGEWQTIALEYPEAFTGKDWTDFTTVEKDLTAYKGKTVQFAFKYVSGESYGAWEIKNFTVQDGDIVVTYQDETIESLNGKTSTAIDRVNLKLNNALVVYVSETQGAYVREGDYAILFFQTGLNLTEGQTLTGDIKFNYAPYYGLPETKDIQDVTSIEGVTTGTGEVAPVETTLDELIELKHIADLCVVKGVTLSSETTGEGENLKTNYYMNLDDKKVQIFDKYELGVIPTEIDETKKYDVTGIFGTIYKNAPEIYPTKIEESTGTGIKSVNVNDNANVNTDAIYNLSGQRVNDTYRGIVIKNGKKFVQK